MEVAHLRGPRNRYLPSTLARIAKQVVTRQKESERDSVRKKENQKERKRNTASVTIIHRGESDRLGSTGFYRILPSFTGFYLVKLCPKLL